MEVGKYDPLNFKFNIDGVYGSLYSITLLSDQQTELITVKAADRPHKSSVELNLHAGERLVAVSVDVN